MEVIHSPLKLVVNALTEEKIKASNPLGGLLAKDIGRQSRPLSGFLSINIRLRKDILGLYVVYMNEAFYWRKQMISPR